MSVQMCQCIPCYLDRALDTDSIAEKDSVTQLLPLEMVETVFTYLDINDVLHVSGVCKRWRFVAATIYTKTQPERLYSTPCFQPFYNDFYASQHLFIFDVSSSMNTNQRKENALIQYNKISQFIAPVIERGGVYIRKFASEFLLKYFATSEEATAFIGTNSKLRDGSKLSGAVIAVIEKIALINDPSKNSHVHIISDMEVTFDEAILSRPELHAGRSKITFHYYDASKNPENDFLKRIEAAYLSQKDSLIVDEVNDVQPENKKRFSDSVELAFYRSKKTKQL